MFAGFGISEFASQEIAYQNIISAAADTFNVDERLIKSIIATESSFDKNAKRYESKLNTYSLGLMQLLPSTARSVMSNQNLTDTQISDPYTNIMAGTKYYSQQLQKYGDPVLAYAAYNAGKVYRKSDGSLVNQQNVNNFAKWYKKYVPESVPSPEVRQTSFLPSLPDILPAGNNAMLYAGIGGGIALILGIAYLAGQRRA